MFPLVSVLKLGFSRGIEKNKVFAFVIITYLCSEKLKTFYVKYLIFLFSLGAGSREAFDLNPR